MRKIILAKYPQGVYIIDDDINTVIEQAKGVVEWQKINNAVVAAR